MCIQEDPVELRWKCGHTAKDIPQSRVIWCPDADARGRPCDTPNRSSKASSRGQATRYDCPACRINKKGGGQSGKDDTEGGAGAGSLATQQSLTTKVH